MINVTTSAKKLLGEMAKQARQSVQAHEKSAVTFRLVADGEEWRVVLDTPHEGDQIVERDGDPVLLVGADIGAALDGATLETEQTSQGKRLVISL